MRGVLSVTLDKVNCGCALSCTLQVYDNNMYVNVPSLCGDEIDAHACSIVYIIYSYHAYSYTYTNIYQPTLLYWKT